MKVYLVKELWVKTSKNRITFYEYRSASADYIFTNHKKAMSYFDWFTKKAEWEKGEWEEKKSPSGIVRINKKAFYEKDGMKIYEAFEMSTKTTI